jgi:molecular chaperone DnaK
MHVSAKDKTTGKENKITIKSNSGLSDEEIQKMIREAEENAESDKKARTLIETRNTAEATLHEVEKDLEEFKDQLTEAEIEEIQAAITAVEIAKQGDDADKIKSELEKVFPAMKTLMEKKQAKEQAQAQAEAQPQSAQDDVVDATFTEKKAD